MNVNEASEWARHLESHVNWDWWYFQSRQVSDGPHWYVEAVNKINGKKHKLWAKGDEKALVGSTAHTGNINSPEEACVYLARCLPQGRNMCQEAPQKIPRWRGDSESVPCQWCGKIGKRMDCHGQDLMFCHNRDCLAHDVPFTPQGWAFLGEMMEKSSLHQQVDKLASFIMRLDCGYPTVNEEFPDGMSATEAAMEYINDLRVRATELEDKLSFMVPIPEEHLRKGDKQ